MKLLHAIPALPASHQDRSTAFYRDQLGFTVAYQQEGFTKLQRDTVELHLWVANDEGWRTRQGTCPVVSGAESFIAGTHSCRIEVEGVDEIYRVMRPLGIVHPNANLQSTHFGTREFGILDPDGNLVTFFERTGRMGADPRVT
jgi:catechol 2,3-dioxygenase-like lactoylglutathione lyase family enzyme